NREGANGVRGVRAESYGVLDALLDTPQVSLHNGGLTRKILVEPSFGHRCFAGEPLDTRGVDALTIEQFGGRVEDALACAAAVSNRPRLCLTLRRHTRSIPIGLHLA